MLNRIEGFATAIYADYQFRTAEQFALSYLLGIEYEIVSADRLIFHYWFFKPALQLLQTYLLNHNHSTEYFVEWNDIPAIIISLFSLSVDEKIYQDILLDHPSTSTVGELLRSKDLLEEKKILYGITGSRE